MPLVSIIIVNWNRKELLERCLASLKAQTFRDYEIIVVDNGSMDGSPEVLRERYLNVHLIDLNENLGFSKGNNIGIRESKGKLIAFLNNDIEADPHWLEELHAPLMGNAELGSCASKMLYYDKRDLIYSTGHVFFAHGDARDRGRKEIDRRQYDEERFVFGACAGAAIYRKSVLDDVGYFDEDFSPAYCEDVDLSFRAQLAGYQCLYVPDAIVYHHAGSTLGYLSSKHIYLCERNRYYVVMKNMPRRLVIRYALRGIAFFFLSFLYWTVHGRGFACITGRFRAFRQMRHMLEKRPRIQAKKRVSDAYIDSIISKKGIISRAMEGIKEHAVEQ